MLNTIEFFKIFYHVSIFIWGFRDHSFSTYAEFSKKLTFLTPDTHTYVCVSEGKKC